MEHTVGPSIDCPECIDYEIDYRERYENPVIVCAEGCPDCNQENEY